MTTIIPGMTPAEFITAMQDNTTALAASWSVNADSFTTLTSSNIIPSVVNYNLRASAISYGQKAASYISALNSGFAAIVHRFQDAFIENITMSEPTALVSDDGNQIDLWANGSTGGVVNIHYSYSTDGLTFSTPVATDIPVGFMRCHILKDDSNYYLYASHNGNSIHLFTSTNKINFTNQGEVIGSGASAENSFVWKEGSNWYMLYEYSAGIWVIGLATASAPEGPWTKYEGNPVCSGLVMASNPEIPRVNNNIIKHNGLYYMYFHSQPSPTGSDSHILRAYSFDLHTWIIEGIILDIRKIHSAAWDYGDVCLVEFKGKSYLFWSPTDQVSQSHIDVGIDNRSLAEMLTLYP